MSDPFESNEYLQAAFDPSTLRVAELRRIFFEHNVDFKSTAKKAELVQIFNEEIRPRAASLLDAKTNPAPSRNKIETVLNPVSVDPISASPTKTPGKRGRPKKHPLPEEDEVANSPAPLQSAVKKSVGRPRKVPKMESDEDAIPSMVTKSSPRKRKSSAAPRSDDEDEIMVDAQKTPAPKTSSKSRKSTVMRENDGPRFSDENPFQSGSSPIAASPNKRRQTAIPNSSQKLAPPLAKENRRKTDGILSTESLSTPSAELDVKTPNVKTAKTPKTASPFKKAERFMPPIEQLRASPAFQSAAQRQRENKLATSQLVDTPSKAALQNVEVGEEFTEEETASLPPSRKRLVRKSPRQPSAVNQLLKWTALLTMTTGSALGANWLRQEKIKAGFCGVDSDPIISKPGAAGFEEIVNQIRPQCEPCPAHAICYQGFRMTCDDEFQKVQNPLSFGGLIPIAAECAPDTEKLRRIKLVADEIVETLRDRTASVECGYTAAPLDGNVGMSATELKEKLMTKKAASITEEQFTTLFDHAIEDVKTREEIEISSGKPTFRDPSNSQTNKLYERDSGRDTGDADLYVEDHYHSTSLANISLTCSIRHTLGTILARYRVELVGLLAMAAIALYLRHFFLSRSSQRIKVQSLVTRVYDELATMKARSVDDPDRYEPHLGVSQLRDSILADDYSYASRENLWHDVQSIVEGNSNVRATQAEIQGEWLRAWEWVGAVRQITREDRRREMGLEEGADFVRPVV